ncbi:hypothetical protein HRE53_02195 [Acaryochloris sp. 'Moss Beach']|nr:hypothetical protein [Acaryochloris sp. 'Moss Beach']UJB69995.1 hypothetical protein HRE53_02195 [Acaryochloris sp. 'Moss Beach']
MVRRSDDTEDAIASYPPPAFSNLKLRFRRTYFCPDHLLIKQRLLGVSL